MGKLGQMHDNVSFHLNRIAENFKGIPKITLIVRNPAVEGDADIVITNDTLDEAGAAIQRRKEAGRT